MGRKTSSTEYIQPVDQSGNPISPAPGADASLTGRGVYTLASGTTYYFVIGGQDARVRSFELEWDNAIIITSANIEDTNVAPSEASDYANGSVAPTSNAWVPEKPSTAYVATVNGNVTSNANGTIGTGGGTSGAAVWNIADAGTRRTRIAVVVGGTGGEVRGSVWGEE